MPDETDNKSDIKKQSEISQSKTPTLKPQPKEELKQEAKQTIEEPAANKPAEEVPKPVVEEEKPKRRYGKAAEPAAEPVADAAKPGLKKAPLKIDESVVDRKSLFKPPNRDAKPKPKSKEEPKEEPIQLKVSPKDGDSTKLKVPEPKTFEATKDIVMEEASVIPIPNPERRPSLRYKYDPMKFIPSDDEVEAGIVESNVETIADPKDNAEVNTKHT